MDEVKDKFKGFMKKVSSSSSSGRFQGEGRVLGSSSSSPSSSSSSSSSNLIPNRRTNPPPTSNPTKPRPLPRDNTQSSDQPRPDSANNPNPDRKPANGFDPFDSLITSGKTSQNGCSLEILECPICQQAFTSEEQVSEHVDVCLSKSNAAASADEDKVVESPSDMDASVCAYLSANPGSGSVEVVLRLLRNIVREPENSKFRRVRMSNAKIKEAVADVAGGVELLETVGFELREEEDGEMWAAMEVPSDDRVALLGRAVQLLEPQRVAAVTVAVEPPSSPVEGSAGSDENVQPRKIDRQMKVFFSVPENVAAKIELPDSFFNLSVEEVRREAEMRKKKMAESQLLVPKSYKEKQAKAARKKYTKTVIRIQFPDGVVLQAIFNPWEPTSSLYKFVSSALKEPSLEFELLHPVVIKRRVIPCFPPAGKNPITLEEEDLVPKALVKFKPIETDSLVFTGLCNELLEISEPLVTE